MKEYETLYTVNDIADIVGVTTRSIRNYIKSGKLTGRRMGGQWRFTQQDIDNLFQPVEAAIITAENNSIDDIPEVGDTSHIDENRYEKVNSFLNSEHVQPEGTVRVCAIVDYYCGHRIEAERKAGSLRAIVNGMNEQSADFNYEYIRAERKVRFIVSGNADYVRQIIEFIKS